MFGGTVLKEAGKMAKLLPAILLSLFFFATPCESVDVLVVGDTQLSPVLEVISGIKETLGQPVKVYSPSNVKDRLRETVAREDAKVVIALGRDAMEEAVGLSSTVAVIYGLVLTPPSVHRPNTTGFYMATPVKEYVAVARRYLPSLGKIAVVGSPDLIRALDGTGGPEAVSLKVKSSFELVETVKKLDSADAILLLPDVALLSGSVLEEVFLSSFRKSIPLLGVSEKNVRQGALLALVFDPANIGRRIGEEASGAVKGADMGKIPPSPPQKFELYVNTATAKKMGLAVSDELIRKAKRVYP